MVDVTCCAIKHKSLVYPGASRLPRNYSDGRGRIVKDVVIRWFGRSFAISIGSPVLWISGLKAAHFQLTISVAPAMHEEHTNEVGNWSVYSSNKPSRRDGMSEQFTFNSISCHIQFDLQGIWVAKKSLVIFRPPFRTRRQGLLISLERFRRF